MRRSLPAIAISFALAAAMMYGQGWKDALKRARDRAAQAAAAATGPNSSKSATSVLNPDLALTYCFVGISMNNPAYPDTYVFSDIFTFNIREQAPDPHQGLKSDIRWKEHVRDTYGKLGWNPALDGICTVFQGRDVEERAKKSKASQMGAVKPPWKILEDHWTLDRAPAIPSDPAVPGAETSPTAAVPANRPGHNKGLVLSLANWYCTSETNGKDKFYVSAAFYSPKDPSQAFAAFLKEKYNYVPEYGVPCYGNHRDIASTEAAMQNQIKHSVHPPIVMTGWKPDSSLE